MAFVINQFDTVHQRRFAFEGTNLAHRLITRNINIPYFNNTAHNDKALHFILHQYALGKCIISGISSQTHCRAIIALEVIAPNLPAEVFANENDARRIFVHSVLAAVNRAASWADTSMVDLGGDAINGIIETLPNDQIRNRMRAAVLGGDLATLIAAIVPAAAAMPDVAETLCRFLKMLYDGYATLRGKSLNTNVYALAYVALGKRGTVTREKLDKIADDIQNECRKTINLDPNEVQVFAREMSPIVTEHNAQAIMDGLAGTMANFSLRLRLTVEQAAKGGMTSYWSIHAALETFPDFPWAEARRYISRDFERFHTACEIVGNNEYYGFRSNLGEAAAPKYKSFSWLAMHLLVAHRGAEYGSLTKYATYNRAPDSQAQLQQLIDQYRPQIQPANEEETRELLDAFRAARIDEHP